jgi:hypothetical protein
MADPLKRMPQITSGRAGLVGIASAVEDLVGSAEEVEDVVVTIPGVRGWGQGARQTIQVGVALAPAGGPNAPNPLPHVSIVVPQAV